MGGAGRGPQAGAWGQTANTLTGQITVWESDQALSGGADDGGLDPDYDAATEVAKYACTPDLAQPLTHACASIRDVEAQAVAALTVSTFGAVGTLADEDRSCGFASAAVLGAVEVTGTPGRRGGQATYTVATPCRLHFPEPTLISEECGGLKRFARGSVWVTGTKTIDGIATGDRSQPIVPTSRQPGAGHMTMRFEDFELSDSSGRPTLRITNGVLVGDGSQLVALDTRIGACSIKTPHARFSGLSWASLSSVLVLDGFGLPVSLTASSLDAVNGTVGGKSNWLQGTVRFDDGEVIAIPAGGGPAVLDPLYDPATFDSTFTCLPNLQIPESEAACSFDRTLAEGVARLLIQTVGTAAQLINGDQRCGFGALPVLLKPTDVVGAPGELGSIRWAVDDCKLGGEGLARKRDTDCDGTTTWTQGVLTTHASRVVQGMRIKVPGTFVDSIVPSSPSAVTLQLSGASLNEFQAYTVKRGASGPEATLVIHSGWLAATVEPRLGERRSDPGNFSVPTPGARITEVVLTNAEVTLAQGGARFRLTIPSASLEAVAGTSEGRGNRLSGKITLDDREVVLGSLPLDPAFQQASFDRGYECTADLAALHR